MGPPLLVMLYMLAMPLLGEYGMFCNVCLYLVGDRYLVVLLWEGDAREYCRLRHSYYIDYYYYRV